jgi:transposase-like protein
MKRTTTRKKITPKLREIKELMAGEEDFLRPLIGLVVQEVLEAEMNEALGAQKGERTEERMGYRSGYYVRNLVTRVGKLELRVPQDRQGRFSTQLFERYQRSEKGLGGGAGGDVRSGGQHSQGQGDYREVVRPGIQRLLH